MLLSGSFVHTGTGPGIRPGYILHARKRIHHDMGQAMVILCNILDDGMKQSYYPAERDFGLMQNCCATMVCSTMVWPCQGQQRHESLPVRASFALKPTTCFDPRRHV
jgi:hypothetical protein